MRLPPPPLLRPLPQPEDAQPEDAQRDTDPAPPPNPAAPDHRRPSLTRVERITAAVIFSGLVVVLGLGAAVMVRPSLVDDFNPYWPLLAAIGFLSTVGGFWWLWWRPR